MTGGGCLNGYTLVSEWPPLQCIFYTILSIAFSTFETAHPAYPNNILVKVFTRPNATVALIPWTSSSQVNSGCNALWQCMIDTIVSDNETEQTNKQTNATTEHNIFHSLHHFRPCCICIVNAADWKRAVNGAKSGARKAPQCASTIFPWQSTMFPGHSSTIIVCTIKHNVSKYYLHRR